MVVQKSIRKNFIYNSILTVSNVLIPLVTFPYVSRVLGANGIGSVEFSISFINYFVMLASLGIPTYGIRACAKVRDNTEKLSKVVEELLLIGLFMTIVCYIIFFICLFFVPQLSSNKPLFLITSLNLLLNTVSMNWLYSALEEYKFITFRTIVFRLIALALTFLLVKSEKDTDVYALILVLSTSGSFVINAIHSRKFIYYKKFPKYDLLKHIPAVMTFFASTVAISVYTNLDSVMLGFMVGGIQVGYYSSALKVRSAVATLSVALGKDRKSVV